MIYLIVSVVLNALLAVIFRYFGEYKINNLPAIVVNYITCFVIGTILSGGKTLAFSSVPTVWLPYLAILGLTFIITFNLIAATVQLFGITITTLMQKMSVLIVVVYSIFAFHESVNTLRIAGFIAGFLAIFLITGRPKVKHKTSSKWLFALPIIVFFTGGFIDSLFVYFSRTKLTSGNEDLFAALLFGIAGLLGLFIVMYHMLVLRKRYAWRDVLGGIVLGIPNFFTVFFLQKMLTSDMDGSVIFPIHNIAILILSAFVSFLLFSERFTKMKIIGILLAVAAIVFLSLGNSYETIGELF